MQPFSLKCHPPGAAVPHSSFFILSRGNNAGRPSYSPNPNCFSFTCEGADLECYFWLVYSLWKTRRFAYYIMGTAIPLIRVRDVRKCIEAHSLTYDQIKPLTTHLEKIDQLERNLRSQIALLANLRLSVLHKALDKGNRPSPLSPDESTHSIF